MSNQMKQFMAQVLRQFEENNPNVSMPTKPKSREGKKVIAGHFNEDIAWQFKKLALDKQVTVQGLMEEAISDLFEKYHLPTL